MIINFLFFIAVGSDAVCECENIVHNRCNFVRSTITYLCLLSDLSFQKVRHRSLCPDGLICNCMLLLSKCSIPRLGYSLYSTLSDIA